MWAWQEFWTLLDLFTFSFRRIKVPVQKIKSFVLGGHGDTMVAMLGLTEIDGKKISELVKAGKNIKRKTKPNS